MSNTFLDDIPSKEGLSSLRVPEALLPTNGSQLPQLTHDILIQLREFGWQRVGLMVAFVDSDGMIMMLNHNGRDKNSHGALGPLGETSRQSGPNIEQPIETLFRGVQEELGVQHPDHLNLWMRQSAGWVVNQWPRGDSYPGEYACAISFPVFVPDSTKDYLLSIPHGNDEVNSLHFMTPEAIDGVDESFFRPGVKQWMQQLQEAGLLSPATGRLNRVDLTSVYASSLHDIEL